MGNQLAVSGSAASINLRDISPSLQQETPLGGRRRGRLFTSLRCSDNGRPIVVKIFIRNFLDKEQNDLLARHVEKLAAAEDAIRSSFWKHPGPCNTLFYTTTTKLDRYCMLTRPYLHFSIPERLAIRPVLTYPQRVFLAYQLLRGLQQLHEVFGVVHGDLKPENTLVTTSGWLYMTDLAPFKPSVIPAYNPANFEYYFDNAEQQYCCLAPERFVDEGAMPPNPFSVPVNPAADVFAAGCIIAQLITEEPLFQLSGVLQFRSKSLREKDQMIRQILEGRNAPNLIVDLCVEAMCPPEADRKSAAALIKHFTPSVFPKHFDMMYSNIVPSLLALPPDIQIQYLWSRFDDVLRAASRCGTDEVFAAAMAGLGMSSDQHQTACINTTTNGTKENGSVADASPLPELEQNLDDTLAEPEKQENFESATVREWCLDIIMPIVCTVIRHVKTTDSRVKALHLLRRASQKCGDPLKRDTLLPYALHYVRSAESPTIVRAIAIRALTTVIEGLVKFPKSECLMFEDWILPSLQDVARDMRPLVRVEFAQCVPRILSRAIGYVEGRQALGTVFNWKASFDYQRHQIVDRGWEMMKPFFTCNVSSVVVALLSALPVIAQVLGMERCTDDLLPLVTTLMGTPVVEVKREMLKQVIELAAFLKTPNPETIRVCVEEGVRDSDPEIVAIALRGIRRLCREKCLPPAETINLVQKSISLLGYPDSIVAHEAALVAEYCSTQLDSVDVLVHLVPPVKPLLRYSIPLQTLSEVDGVLVPAATLAQSNVRRHNTLCADWFSVLKGKVESIALPGVSQVRGAGDVPSDKTHVDVDEQNCEKHPIPGDAPWSMSVFHPTARQRKRLHWRSWKPHSAISAETVPRTSTLPPHSSSHPQRHSIRSSSAAPMQSNAPPRQRRIDFVSQTMPMRPCAAPIAVSHDHEGPIYALSFLMGSLASCGSGGQLRIWDIDETVTSDAANLLRPLISKRIFPMNISALSAEYLNQSVVACGGSDGTLAFFDIESESVTKVVTPANGAAGGLSACCSIGRNSPLVAVGTHRGLLFIVDERTREPVWNAEIHRSPISSMVPIGSTDWGDAHAIACGTLRGCVPLVDLRLRHVVQSFTVPATGITGPCVHCVAKAQPINAVPHLLVATSAADVVQYNMQTMEKTMMFRPSSHQSVRVLMPIPLSSCFVSGGTDRLLRVWDVSSPESSYSLVSPPHRSPAYSATITPECTTVTEAASPAGSSVAPSHADHITALTTVVVSQQMFLASGSRDGTLKLWHNISSSTSSSLVQSPQ